MCVRGPAGAIGARRGGSEPSPACLPRAWAPGPCSEGRRRRPLAPGPAAAPACGSVASAAPERVAARTRAQGSPARPLGPGGGRARGSAFGPLLRPQPRAGPAALLGAGAGHPGAQAGRGYPRSVQGPIGGSRRGSRDPDRSRRDLGSLGPAQDKATGPEAALGLQELAGPGDPTARKVPEAPGSQARVRARVLRPPSAHAPAGTFSHLRPQHHWAQVRLEQPGEKVDFGLQQSRVPVVCSAAPAGPLKDCGSWWAEAGHQQASRDPGPQLEAQPFSALACARTRAACDLSQDRLCSQDRQGLVCPCPPPPGTQACWNQGRHARSWLYPTAALSPSSAHSGRWSSCHLATSCHPPAWRLVAPWGDSVESSGGQDRALGVLGSSFFPENS